MKAVEAPIELPAIFTTPFTRGKLRIMLAVGGEEVPIYLEVTSQIDHAINQFFPDLIIQDLKQETKPFTWENFLKAFREDTSDPVKTLERWGKAEADNWNATVREEYLRVSYHDPQLVLEHHKAKCVKHGDISYIRIVPRKTISRI